MNWKKICVEAAVLIVVSTIAGVASNLIRGDSTRLAWIGQYGRSSVAAVRPPGEPAQPDVSSQDPRAVAPPKDPGAPYLEISGEVAHRLHEAGAVFLDARRTGAYQSAHIKGARSLSVWEHDAEAKVGALVAGRMPPDQVMVTYCSGPDCEDSAMLAEKLSMAGFFNVYVYKDGFPDWEKRGLPIAREGAQ
jgi:rhodanese-related sulfurtransferase